jgi:hypothetical protein
MNKTSFLIEVEREWQNENKRYCTSVEKKARSPPESGSLDLEISAQKFRIF